MKDTLSGLAAGLSAAAIWGGMYVVSKVVLEIIPPPAWD
jgi:drug/metabolite transporter (DMT)-like permease